MISYSGKNAIVTGGANGIGSATAQLLVELGARVAVFDREQAASAPNIKSYIVDLSDLKACEDAVNQVKRDLGSIEILINVAGVSIPNFLAELNPDSYQKTLAVNLKAPVFLMKFVGNEMAKNGYGRMVSVTSVHARQSEPASIAYDITKAGLEAATRTAALELAESGVLVNAVAPGFVMTRMSIVDGVDETESDWFKNIYLENKRLPLQRAAQPIEIARTIAWLASDTNTYVTGQTLVVDGGISSRF
ncbi:MAG: SDR family oxidoreductase [Actinobacteria bacterium]|nr:SDR family oxidoreductase [Actinomycetota bacterium]